MISKLPAFISDRSRSNNESQSSFMKILTGLAPVSLTPCESPRASIVEHGEIARADQTMVERIQQERMIQERQVALADSVDLASGKSALLKNSSIGAESTTNQLNAPQGNGKSRSMSMPDGLPALTVQQAALAAAIHHRRRGSNASSRRVTFHALVDPMPAEASQVFHRVKRERSYSHSDSYPAARSAFDASRCASISAQPVAAKTLIGRVVAAIVDGFRELFFLIHLCFLLISQLPLFGRWMFMTTRLVIFATLLASAWVKIGYAALFCHRIERSIQYGPYNRNFLDIYLPTNSKGSILTPIFNSRQFEIELARELGAKVVPNKYPVFVYVTGGAWIIGYKAWGALLALTMRALGFIVVSVDYRNFPQGNIEDMIIDCECALKWVYDNIENYGGDKEQLHLSGQSAGGHITAILLLRNAKREAEGAFNQELREAKESSRDDRLAQAHASVAEASAIVDIVEKEMHRPEEKTAPEVERRVEESKQTDSPSAPVSPEGSPSTMMAVSSALRTGFPISRIKGYIGISGVYAMSHQVLNHLHASGLPGGVVCAIMGGAEHLTAVDPTRMIHQAEYRSPKVTALIPPVLLIAGSCDRSVPLSIPHDFASSLANAGVPVTFRCYIGATHTSPIIEWSLRGGHHLAYDIKTFIDRCQNGDAQLTRLPLSSSCSARSEPIRIDRLPSLRFHVRGETMVNSTLVKCAAFFNPF